MTERCSQHPEPQIDTVSDAALRHDLVNPINLIVGYSDLLLGDLAGSGRTAEQVPLESIRDRGYLLLHLIDQVLTGDGPDHSPRDLERLGRRLLGPAAFLIRECDALLELSTAGVGTGHDPAAVEFADDLRKIRSAGLRMRELAGALGTSRATSEALRPSLPHHSPGCSGV